MKRYRCALALLAALLLAWGVLTLDRWGGHDAVPPQPAATQQGAPVIPTPEPAGPAMSMATKAIAPPPRDDSAAAHGPSVDAAWRTAVRSNNYRQYIHEVLAHPDPERLRVAMALYRSCSFIKDRADDIGTSITLPPDLQATLTHRLAACRAGGGPDFQQFQALSAIARNRFQLRDNTPSDGNLQELARFHREGDSMAMAAWGLRESRQLVEGEPLLANHAGGPAGTAWQLAVCERYACDDFHARLMRCRDERSCQMSFQDIMKEASGVDAPTWAQLLAAARRRVHELLPD